MVKLGFKEVMQNHVWLASKKHRSEECSSPAGHGLLRISHLKIGLLVHIFFFSPLKNISFQFCLCEISFRLSRLLLVLEEVGGRFCLGFLRSRGHGLQDKLLLHPSLEWAELQADYFNEMTLED